METIKQALLQDIISLVEIPSVYQESQDFPFGKPIDQALVKAMEIMKEKGFHIFIDPNRMYGYAEVGSGELFGVLGHLDVVEAREEDGWNTPPFTPTLIDNKLYGRGTQDDKGPMIAAIHAFCKLQEEGHLLKKRVRFIFGLDEENLWRCMNSYTAKEETPSMGFTPDSSFPLIYAEKGLLQVKIHSTQPSPVPFTGGDNFNSVSAHASCPVEKTIQSTLESLDYTFKIKDDMLVVSGITAHAKNPWKGTNANLRLLEALQKSGITNPIIEFACNHLNNQFKFEGFSEKDLSDFTGPLTINLGKMEGNETGSTLCIDMRLPASVKKEDVLSTLQQTASKYDLTVEEYDWLRPIHVPKDSELIQVLMASYQKVTGDTTSEPMISAGATYARAFDNCVAFGPNFPGKPTSEHQPNEFLNMDDIMKCYHIYKEAFLQLVFDKQ